MKDRFWVNTWIFLLVVTALASLMMGGLFLMNNEAQNSDEASVEEKEAIDGITYELWKEARVLIPTSLLILITTALVYIKFGDKLFPEQEDKN